MRKILQSEASECGLACLAMIADYYGYHVELNELRRKFSVSLKGATLEHLIRHASALSLSARPLRLDIDELGELKLPCVIHWNLNHFVVLKSIKKNLFGSTKVVLYDPSVGERELSLTEVSQSFTGVAIEFSPNQAFEKKQETKRISIADLTGKIFGLRRALIQIFLLSLTLEIFSLISPLFNQFIIDEVIVTGDDDLLKILSISFGILLITQTLIDIARSWFLTRWSIDIGLQWTSRVFSHLLKLPISFFEKRHLGDILSKFGSVGSIQNTLTSLFVESALDGLMATFALTAMLVYSLRLTIVVLLGLLSYVILRAFFYYPLREASRERLVLSSRENSIFLETMRAITPLKLFGRESDRLVKWRNCRQDVINRDIKTQKLGIVFKISATTISSFQTLIMFYLGAELVMANALSVGMLTAFASYAGTFSSRIFSLIDSYVSVKMLGMHIDRLTDIVGEPVENEVEVERDTRRIKGSLELRNIKFRYAEGEPWILNGIDLIVRPGENLALVGPSGCGKSTLCKIILGLLPPTEGEVLIDNIPISQLGLRAYRQLVGTVMQDDVLLAGSIADNISFFDNNYDADLIEQCAKQAAIFDEISAMPMGFQTLVGDMGSSLSGGQKQRLLLARALYKKPLILALDEATSHLDIHNEKKVNETLKVLNLTRIMVAHRPETIRSAARVVALSNGRLLDVKESVEAQKLAIV